MEKLYISIPNTGLQRDKVRQKADLLKSKYSRLGYKVVIPFDIYAGKNPTYEDRICYNLRAMLDCDAILFCYGWHLSCGCNIAHDVAVRFKAANKKNFKLLYE